MGSFGKNLWPSILGIAATFVGTSLAIFWIPEDPQPAGALFVSACWMSAGLLLVPILRTRASMTSVLRVENILMGGLVYWLLLDLLVGAYPLYEVPPATIRVAFVAISIFSYGIWLGIIGRGWSLPKFVLRAAHYRIPELRAGKGHMAQFLSWHLLFRVFLRFRSTRHADRFGRGAFQRPVVNRRRGRMECICGALDLFRLCVAVAGCRAGMSAWLAAPFCRYCHCVVGDIAAVYRAIRQPAGDRRDSSARRAFAGRCCKRG